MGNYRSFRIVLSLLVAATALLGSSAAAAAQEATKPQEPSAPAVTAQQGTQQAVAPEVKPEPTDVLNTTGKMKIGVAVMFGVGSKSIDFGTTTSGDTVKISGGGGTGLELTAGYGLSQSLEFDVSLGGQSSTETPAVSNADATFSRSYLRATLKYLVPVRDRIRFKFGGGVGVYNGGKLDIDTTQIAGGSREIVKYDSAVGVHVVGEFEGLIRNDFTFVAGLRLYGVTYKANSWEHNGVAQPTSALRDDVRNLDGGGADVFIGFAKYF